MIVIFKLLVAVLVFGSGKTDTSSNETLNIPKYVPKCCNEEEIYDEQYTCNPSTDTPKYIEFKVFESNETHINNETKQRPIPTKAGIFNCSPESRFGVEKGDFLGIIYNSSVILNMSTNVLIIPPTNYCMEYMVLENGDQEIVSAFCATATLSAAARVTETLYFVFLVLSTFSFFCCAVIYVIILVKYKTNGPSTENKKCFIMYCLTMGMANLTLAVMQKVDEQCGILSTLFYVAIISSYSSMTCLCIDLYLHVRNFKKEMKRSLFLFYFTATFGISLCLYFLSLLPDGIPEIPNSFIVQSEDYSQGSCTFSDNKLYWFFIPAAIYVATTAICIGLSYRKIRFYNSKYTYDIIWLEHRGIYRYTLYKCLMVFVFMGLSFLVQLMVTLMRKIEVEISVIIALQMIVSLQGVFIFFNLVVHYHEKKYMSDVYDHIDRMNNREMLPMNGIKSNHEASNATSDDSHILDDIH